MNQFAEFIGRDWITALGWALFHSLWQATLVAVILAGLLLLMRRFTARTRYLVGIMALALVVMISLLSFNQAYSSGTATKVIDLSSDTNEHASEAYISKAGVLDPVRTSIRNSPLNKAAQYFSQYIVEYYPLLVTLWFIGILLYIFRFIGGFILHQRLRVYRTAPVSPACSKTFLALKKKMRIDKGVQILESSLVKIPLAFGYFKPVLLLPVGFVIGLSPSQVEAVLAHELAHISRRDYLLNIFQTLIDILYFFNPAVRWISTQVRMEREHCCDDIAVAVSQDPVSFARVLTEIHTQVEKGPSTVMALFHKKEKLLMRVKRILSKPRLKSNFSEGAAAATFLFAALLGVTVLANAATDWNIAEIRAYTEIAEQKTIESSVAPVTQNTEKLEFSRFVLDHDSLVKIEGHIVSEDNKPEMFSWIINEKSGGIVWKLQPENIHQQGVNYNYQVILSLSAGQYKWYSSQTDVTVLKVLGAADMPPPPALAAPPVPASEPVPPPKLDAARPPVPAKTAPFPAPPVQPKLAEAAPLPDQPARPKLTKAVPLPAPAETPLPPLERSIQYQMAPVPLPAPEFDQETRILDFTQKLNDKERRIRAVIKGGRIAEFVLDNIQFLKEDIVKNWEMIINILGEFEDYRFVYKKPGKKINFKS